MVINPLTQNNHTNLRNDVFGNSNRKLDQKQSIPRSSIQIIFKKRSKIKTTERNNNDKRLLKHKKGSKLIELRDWITDFPSEDTNRFFFRTKSEFWSDFHLMSKLNFRYFSIEVVQNLQNDKTWFKEPPKSKHLIERQIKPKNIIIWARIENDAITLSVFVRFEVKINTDPYRQQIL